VSDKTKIEWTDATWNPIRGCSRVSEGCRHCYAERVAARFSGPGQPYEGLAILKREPGEETAGDPRWTGEVRFIPELLNQPLRWKRPRRIFVNSMSDLFHEKTDVGWIDQICAAMLVCPHHTFQVLTKRPERMRNYLLNVGARQIEPHMQRLRPGIARLDWPWRNIWWGVSVEDQKTADDRIPLLLETPAAVRWVSYEPALGPVDWYRGGFSLIEPVTIPTNKKWPGLDWLVAGGESGPGARPAHPDWFLRALNECKAAGVPFFFKQWGEWIPVNQWEQARDYDGARKYRGMRLDGKLLLRVGKKRAGHLLDGRAWQEFPAVRS
jgi:protein gp37